MAVLYRWNGTAWDPVGSQSGTVPYLIGTARSKRTAGNIGTTSTTYVAVDTATDLTIPGVATGDVLEVQANFRWNDDAELAFMDAATWVSGAAVNYVSASVGASGHGVGGWLGQVSQRMACGGSVEYVLQSGDISSGSVTVRFLFKTNGGASKSIIANTNQPFHVNAKVWRVS